MISLTISTDCFLALQVSADTDNSDAEEQYVDFNSDTDTDGSEDEATEDEGTNGNVQTDMNLHLLYDEEGRSTSVRREGRTATPSSDGLSNRRQKLDTLRSALALFKVLHSFLFLVTFYLMHSWYTLHPLHNPPPRSPSSCLW